MSLFENWMYILLFKVSCSSFSAVAVCTYVWTDEQCWTDGQPFTKIKSDGLTNTIYFRVQSIKRYIKIIE